MGIAVSGSDLFVSNLNNNTIGEYTTSGATVNASLISGLNHPHGIAVDGSDLFVTSNGGTIGEYTTSGATVNASLISGLDVPFAIVTVTSTPEPATIALIGTSLLAIIGLRRLRRRPGLETR